ncbi:MAG: hypothetical protein DRI89_09350 [Bacteroidetes bacterium]|nr:MAG: hypothetical protein DRI89_09350 [Bacteroidota bacterium]
MKKEVLLPANFSSKTLSMKFKVLLSLFVSVVLTISIFAKDISVTVAEKVAINLLFEKTNTFDKAVDYNSFQILESYKVANAYYVINFEKGWVLVSADDAMTPVIGYNFENNFPSPEVLDENVKSWMQNFVDQKQYINKNNIKAEATTLAEWEKYTSNNPELFLATGERNEVEILLTGKWNQDSPYNVQCPEDAAGPGGHVYVGCVATAMVQIMYYWRYPIQGSGVHSHNWPPYGTMTVNYGNATYEWDAMLDRIDNASPDEIAEIGYHAAISVDMMFSPDGSGAYSWDVPYAMRTYFNYDNSVQYVEKGNYSFATWETMLQTELDNARPMYYSGFSNSGGHAFVCDAYQGSNFYHFNFGWSGSSNGYYTLQDVGGFNSGQGMVRYIEPDDANYPYIADGADTLRYFSGSFTDGSGPAEDYPSGMSASWLIDPQTDIDSIESITLSFTSFKTSATDYVRIYDGATTDKALLGEYSGDNLPDNITSSNNKMLVTFNPSGSGSGFKAEYKTASPKWCNSQTYTEPTGILTDGSGSFYYDNSTTCVYIIDHPEAVQISIEFTAFSTEADKDFVQVYNGNNNQLIGEFSGHQLPETISEETDVLIIVWNTSSSVRDDGWLANYWVDGVGVEENTAGNFLAYPNPTDGQLNIQFDFEQLQHPDIRLLSIDGKLIFSETLSGTSGSYKNTFDISDQPKGIYILSIIADNKKVNRKVVIK